MSNLQVLKKTYIDDIEKLQGKPRFGYFSIPSSCLAGNTEFQQKKNELGKVKTQNRNIYPGPTSSGSLKKMFFSYIPSVYRGDSYYDPGKLERQQKLKEQKKYAEKEVYKPTSLTKTCIRASYQYISKKQQPKIRNKRDQNGKVIIEPPNIHSSPTSKVQRQKLKDFKYVEDPYNNSRVKRRQNMMLDLSKRGESFKAGSPVKDFFSSFKQQFGNQILSERLQKIVSKANNKTSFISQGPFKPPGKISMNNFSYPQYLPEGKKPIVKQISTIQQKQTFKLIKKNVDTKPSPSISCLKMNLMKSMR